MHALIVGAFVMGAFSAPVAEDEMALGPERIAAEVRSADVVDGASGSFVAGKRVIHFETARLPRDKDAQTEHPDRDYDIALRLLDGNGRTLLILTEGDATPEQWKREAIEAEPRPTDPAILRMAAKAAQRVDALQFSAELQVEKSLLSSQLALLGSAADREPPSDVDTKGVRQAALYYQQAIDSYWKPAFFNSSPFHHTSTATYRFYNYFGRWYWLAPAIIKCNHGTCPLDPSMSYYKTNWGSVVSSPVYPQECSGVYGLPHVCNNDTLLQQKNVYYNSYYNTWLDSACIFRLLWRP